MKCGMKYLLTFVLGLCVFSAGPAAQDAISTIEIDASRPAAYPIPRTIFGSFLEPIGHSIYRGLWAEELENPSFEDNLWSADNLRKMMQDNPAFERASELGLPLPWEPLDSTEGNRYEPRWNDAANSYRSLEIMGLPGKEVGIRQRVELPVHRTLRYAGSIYVKHLSGRSEVEVSIRERNRPESVFVRAAIKVSGSGWSKYPFTLEIPEGKIKPLRPADFVVALSDSTRVLVDQVSLMAQDNIEGLDTDIIAMAKAMNTPLVRFGGNFTSAYNWRDGVGPRDKRFTMLNLAWGMPEYNQFGTDEFLEFCRLIGAQPQIALNLGTGTPEEAADWVRYVNQHWGHGGRALLWELGNELWGKFQVGYPAREQVGRLTKSFSNAVRAADPEARLIATGGDPDTFQDWNAVQLENPPGTFNFLSTHFVVTTSNLVNKNASKEIAAEAAFALPVQLERQLHAMHKQIAASHDKDVRTAFTEWLFWAPDASYPRYDNVAGAIDAAGFLNMLLRTADIVPISDMTGIVEFAGIWKKRGQVFAAPAYYVFKMYSHAGISRTVETRSSVETYDVHQGDTRLSEISDVPYLDSVAGLSESADKLTLFCVNRHLTHDIRARISIIGFAVSSEAIVYSLHSDSIYDQNDAEHPAKVQPTEMHIPVTTRTFEYTFPRASVTEIQFAALPGALK
jgi:alpha-N-arabinofuranosidase